ncbi:MAG: alpha/beta fold hydrolase [Nitrospinota bacterium]
MAGENSEKAYLLVHGSCHGAFCWEEVISHIEKRGKKAYTLDLPGHGARIPERPKVRYEDYPSAVVGFIEKGDLKNVVLVGHSMAGIVIPKVAERIPERLSHLIFLSAFVLQDGESLVDNCPPEQQTLFADLAGQSPDNTVMFPENVFLEFFANGMDVDKAKAAYRKLTPTPYHPYTQKVDLKNFYGMDLPMSYVFCKRDKALPDGWWHPKMSSRIKHTYAEIDTCHEVMFSEPEACAETIIRMGG